MRDYSQNYCTVKTRQLRPVTRKNRRAGNRKAAARLGCNNRSVRQSAYSPSARQASHRDSGWDALPHVSRKKEAWHGRRSARTNTRPLRASRGWYPIVLDRQPRRQPEQSPSLAHSSIRNRTCPARTRQHQRADRTCSPFPCWHPTLGQYRSHASTLASRRTPPCRHHPHSPGYPQSIPPSPARVVATRDRRRRPTWATS